MRINSHCGAGRDSGNLCRKFGSRGHAVGIVDQGRRSRLWGTRFWDPGCRGLVSRGLGSGVLCVGVRIPDPASGIPPWDPAPGSRLGVPGPALGCRVPLFRYAQLSVRHGGPQYFASFGILHLLIQ